jgi:hypothetical protein
MLPTDGNGNNSIKYSGANSFDVTAGGSKVASLGKDGNVLTGSVKLVRGDLDAPGGLAVSYQFFKNRLIPTERTAMTASVVPSGSAAGLYAVYTEIPAVRAGSILGLSVLTTNAPTAGAVSASVTVDGAAVGTPLILSAGTQAATTFAKDTYTFSGSQKLGVTITGSAEYVTANTSSASFAVSVLVEM